MNEPSNNPYLNLTIFTDGACSGNPGPGGYGVVIFVTGKEEETKKEFAGGEGDTTNNQMELTAVVKALEHLGAPCTVNLTTDSKYVCDAINKGWLENWKRLGWKRKDGKLQNPDLWKALDEQLERHQCTFHWVKGHADNPHNSRCDELAVIARDYYKENPKAEVPKKLWRYPHQTPFK